MSLFAIGDLHLPFSNEKPMDIFDGWDNYTTRIEESWHKQVASNDTVVLVGDTSWAMRIEDSYADFAFIDKLPGEKLIIKGNHDYWWTSYKKMQDFFKEKGLFTLKILHNNSYTVEDTAVVGTRGWMFETGIEQDAKIIAREHGRLEMSLKAAEKGKEIYAFLHYPPISPLNICEDTLALLKKYNVKKCFYGHLHGRAITAAVEGLQGDIFYKLVSADALKFSPYKIF